MSGAKPGFPRAVATVPAPAFARFQMFEGVFRSASGTPAMALFAALNPTLTFEGAFGSCGMFARIAAEIWSSLIPSGNSTTPIPGTSIRCGITRSSR